MSDITEHPTREGKLYCCVMLDAYSRRVVGWAIDSHQRADLATSALAMAIDARSTAGQIPDGIIHGDRGTQFTSACGASTGTQHPSAVEKLARDLARRRSQRQPADGQRRG